MQTNLALFPEFALCQGLSLLRRLLDDHGHVVIVVVVVVGHVVMGLVIWRHDIQNPD